MNNENTNNLPEGLYMSPNGIMLWNRNYTEYVEYNKTEYNVYDRYIVSPERIRYFNMLINTKPVKYPNIPRPIEEAMDAMMIFTNDSMVIDQVASLSKGSVTKTNDGLECKWSLSSKSIKKIEAKKEECKIYLKEFWGRGCLEMNAEQFDAVLEYVQKCCPKAVFGRI